MEKELFERNKHKIVREVLEIKEFDGPAVTQEGFVNEGIFSLKTIKEAAIVTHVIPLTKDARCCFLNEDLSCNIYDERPHICRKFGDESHMFMTCLFQSKDGRIRSRQEQRALVRKMDKNKLNILAEYDIQT